MPCRSRWARRSRERPPSCRTWRSGTTPPCWWSTPPAAPGTWRNSRASGEGILPGLGLSAPARFTGDARERGQLWQLRKGLYASVAGARPQGTTALLEDIVVPVPVLGRTCRELIRLFDKYSYSNSVIFGHAKDGNVHFMLTDGFATAAELDRYSAFTEDMVDLVLAEGGSLKAEHGTGRVMAPYVRRQYGDELYDVMRSIKRLFDPAAMLNPGVLMDEDPLAHLRHIKTAPPVAEEVDRCVSCGYCEPVCPSKDITLTPRQRIVTLRAIESARLAGDTALVKELEKDYEYESVDTCAVDGMCQTACPVDINTGSLVKRLRKADAGPLANGAWNAAAKHWEGVTRGASLALTVVDKLPAAAIAPPNKAARAVLGTDTVPLYSAELPGGGSVRKRPTPAGAVDAVYFPACVGTMFGPAGAGQGAEGRGVQYSFEQLCARAGLTLLVPDGIDGLCCGTPWSSKGMAAGQETMREKTLAALREATRDGELPDRLRRVLLHRGPAPGRGVGRARGRAACPAHGGRRGLRRGTDPAPAARPREAGVTGPPPHLLLHPDGPQRCPRCRRRGRGRPGRGPGKLGLLRVRRRPGHAAPRTDGLGHRETGRGGGGHGRCRARLVQPDLRTGHDPGHGCPVPPRAGAAGGSHPLIHGNASHLCAHPGDVGLRCAPRCSVTAVRDGSFAQTK